LRAGAAEADAKKTGAVPKTSRTAPKKKAAPSSKAAGKSGKKAASSGKTAPKTAAKAGSGGAAAAARTPVKSAGKAPPKTAGKKSAASKRGKQAPRVTWRNRQTEPTPERYKEIQGALAAKGFLDPADASGAWSQGSADALKKFQASQNIEASGKIDSLSLIALGLGPKRDAAAKAPEPQPAQQQITPSHVSP
jgi:hypothetical protein